MKFAYRNAHLLDGTRDMLPRDGLAVLTDGETIAGIVPEEAVPEGFEPVDLGGKYLMPGLINLHVHLAGNGKPQKKQRDNEKLVRRLMGTGLSRAAAYHVVADFARLEDMRGGTTIRTVSGWAPASWRPTRASPSPAATWRAPSPWRRRTSRRPWLRWTGQRSRAWTSSS